MFQVTWNFKIGTVGIFFFYFVQNFYLGIKRKQYVRIGKSHGILYKKKKVRVGSEKLGMVGLPETHFFFSFRPKIAIP